ncbi:hypothetical protein Kisp02_65460 [Kineosporia sp. NBRC 101731]|nr:hypothetical protein Kisp02_65460 [Kineosporia sp. NBRC 101731]
MDTAAVEKLIGKYTDGRTLGLPGEPGADVLERSLTLDEA